MTTLTLNAEVTADGMLHLAVPSGLPPGKVEVVIIIQPEIELNATPETSYKWLLNAEYDTIGYIPTVENKKQKPRSREERARRIMELLDIALQDVTWEEIEEGRQDRCF